MKQSEFPEYVLKFKRPGIAIHHDQGKFKIYEISSKWDPAKKRAQKVTGKYLGRITEKDGLIPPKEKKIPKETEVNLDILGNLDGKEDPRSWKNQVYSVDELIVVMLLGLLCGAGGWAEFEVFARSKRPLLMKMGLCLKGVPSDDTFRRLMEAFDSDKFKNMLKSFVGIELDHQGTRVIAIDGKTLRHSYDRSQNKRATHVVSAFEAGTSLVLGQEAVEEKSNEITAIPALLETLDITNSLITIDAMGCQHAIGKTIVEKGGS